MGSATGDGEKEEHEKATLHLAAEVILNNPSWHNNNSITSPTSWPKSIAADDSAVILQEILKITLSLLTTGIEHVSI